jgi:hypothetical protein
MVRGADFLAARRYLTGSENGTGKRREAFQGRRMADSHYEIGSPALIAVIFFSTQGLATAAASGTKVTRAVADADEIICGRVASY